MPRSPQKATRCAAGIAIGMQQRKLAMAISACAAFAGKPKTRAPCTGPAAGPAMTGGAGIGRSTSAASGRMVRAEKTPNPSMVRCQPQAAMARSNTTGQIAPATY